MEVKIYNKPSEKGMAVREKVFIKSLYEISIDVYN